MRETKEHTEAFNEYYLMGDSRSLRELALHRGFTDRAVKNWSKEFNWQERIRLRDIELSRREIKKVDDAIISTKADMLKMVEDKIKEELTHDGYTTTLIGQTKEKIEKKQIKVDTSGQISELQRVHQGSTKIQVELMKLALLLIGEADSRTEHSGSLLDIILERKRQAENE